MFPLKESWAVLPKFPHLREPLDICQCCRLDPLLFSSFSPADAPWVHSGAHARGRRHRVPAGHAEPHPLQRLQGPGLQTQPADPLVQRDQTPQPLPPDPPGDHSLPRRRRRGGEGREMRPSRGWKPRCCSLFSPHLSQLLVLEEWGRASVCACACVRMYVSHTHRRTTHTHTPQIFGDILKDQ